MHPLSIVDTDTYIVIPLSIQKERDVYLVGNAEMGDYYHFPQDGVRILTLLASGHNSATIKSTLVDEQGELVDVDGFIELLSSIGFIRFKHQTPDPHEQLQAPVQDFPSYL